eukprot:4876806-Pyramimonas_sp.AAC.1
MYKFAVVAPRNSAQKLLKVFRPLGDFLSKGDVGAFAPPGPAHSGAAAPRADKAASSTGLQRSHSQERSSARTRGGRPGCLRLLPRRRGARSGLGFQRPGEDVRLGPVARPHCLRPSQPAAPT